MPLNATIPEPVIELLHGVEVTDRFRWLEDRTSESTSAWIVGQQLRHDAYFAKITGIDALRRQVAEHLNAETVDQPVVVAGRVFYRRRWRNQEQGSICVKSVGDSEERVLVDPSSLGPFASVGIHHVSSDGELLAYQLKHGGTDAMEIHFVHTTTGQYLRDSLPLGCARGLLFTPDNGGFFYVHEESSGFEDHSIRLHKFGNCSNDAILFRHRRTSNSRLVLLGDEFHLGALCRYEKDNRIRTDLYSADRDQYSDWRPVFSNKPSPYEPFLYQGRIFVFTDEDAPNGKLIELSKSGTEVAVLVPESRSRIEQYTFIHEEIYVRLVVDQESVVRVYRLDGSQSEAISLPFNGTVQLLPRKSSHPNCLFCTYESFDTPPAIYKYHSDSKTFTRFSRALTPSRLHSICVHKTRYTSFDGTEIPIFIVMRRDIDLATRHPVVMTGYGGFGVSMTPKYSVLTALLVELGVIFAVPCIRGGSEFGKEWHEAARRTKRQIAVNDFLSAARWLSRWKASAPRDIGIFGGSNAGLLVAAALTQQPSLFRAVLCIAPLLDMVRYELFDSASRWRQEYGSVDDSEDFNAIYAYSPYHHVAEELDYPATLFVTGDRDDRCNPAHVRKMAARLQERRGQTRPILVDYSAERGHSPVLPLSVRIDALTRRIAFFCREMSIDLPVGGLP